MTPPDPDNRRWRCPACGAVYVSPIELVGAPTHRCRPNVARVHTMIPDDEESDA